MPPIAGFGMGIDRLTALLLNIQNIRATSFFPTLKPVGKE
jgi:lysyl-tRNA synthetase class II